MSRETEMDELEPLLSKKQRKIIYDASKKLNVSYEDVFVFLMENQLERIYSFGKLKEGMTLEKMRERILENKEKD